MTTIEIETPGMSLLTAAYKPSNPTVVETKRQLHALIEARLFAAEKWVPEGKEHDELVEKLVGLGLWEPKVTAFNIEGGVVHESAIGSASNALLTTALLGLQEWCGQTFDTLGCCGLGLAVEEHELDKQIMVADAKDGDARETVMRPLMQRLWREEAEKLFIA